MLYLSNCVGIEVLGSLSNDDGNGTERERLKTVIDKMRTNNRATRAAGALAELFNEVCQMTT